MINKLGYYKTCQTCGAPLRLFRQRVVGSCQRCARNTIDSIKQALDDPAKLRKVKKLTAKQGYSKEEIDETIKKLEEKVK